MSGIRATCVALVTIMFSSVSLSGCIHDAIIENLSVPYPEWYGEMEFIDDPMSHTDSCFSTPCVRNFTIGEPFSDEIWDETGNKWAVFGNVEGGSLHDSITSRCKANPRQPEVRVDVSRITRTMRVLVRPPIKLGGSRCDFNTLDVWCLSVLIGNVKAFAR